MSKSVNYLNTRILQYPAANSPIVMASVQGFTFDDEQLYSPAFDQAVISQIDQLKHKYATRRSVDTLSHDVASATHLELLAKEMKAGKINQESVCMFKHPTQKGVVIQIHLQ